MMTSCVFALFFLLCLSSSITADGPTGLKVRITNRAEKVLKDVGLKYLQELVNKPFPDFQFQWGAVNIKIKRLTLTHLNVNPDQVVLSFQQNSGLQFEIKDLAFAAELERDVNLILWKKFNSEGVTAFGGEGVSAAIGLKLNRDQRGRMNVGMLKCDVRANNIIMKSTGKLGLLDRVVPLFQTFFINKICPAIQKYAVPKVNSMLEDLTMVVTLDQSLGINLDYSLSGDVTVTSNSLDVPFKGLVFRRDQTVNTDSGRRHIDPVFTQSDLMAYVGVSEFFFNSASMSLHSTGAMERTEEVKDGSLESALRALQLFRQPLRIEDRLVSKLEITEAPSISISQRDGFKVKGRARVRVFAVRSGHEEQLLSVSATCSVDMKINIKGHDLTLPSDQEECVIITENRIRDMVVKLLNPHLTRYVRIVLRGYFNKGVRIPLPEAVSFTQGKIDYHDGFVVVGGNLDVTPAGRREMVKALDRRRSAV